MKKNILITGHLGFIGGELYKKFYLKKDEYNVYGIDLKEGNDIRNRHFIDKKFEEVQPDIVIHLAALAGIRSSKEYPEEYISTNILGTQNIVDMCEKHNVKRILFYSSSSVIGGNKNLEIGLTEEDSYNSISLYATTKVTGEFIVKAGKTPYIIIRPFTVYGENGRKDMVIYKWINQIKTGKAITFFGDGDTQRGYTYRGDLVDATFKLANDFEIKNQIINLGGSEAIRLKELLEMFKSKCERKGIEINIDNLPLPNEDVESSFADTGKAKNLIGFNPEKQFKNIINKILDKEL